MRGGRRPCHAGIVFRYRNTSSPSLPKGRPITFRRAGGLFLRGERGKESVVAVVISGRIERLEIPRLCRRVLAALPESPSGVVVCDVRGIAPDAVAVDALARLHLSVRRRGGEVRLCGASEELRDLLDLTGLAEVLADVPR
ncbi:MAG: STAS domain-containing protein [Actinomycetota bacterium]